MLPFKVRLRQGLGGERGSWPLLGARLPSSLPLCGRCRGAGSCAEAAVQGLYKLGDPCHQSAQRGEVWLAAV